MEQLRQTVIRTYDQSRHRQPPVKSPVFSMVQCGQANTALVPGHCDCVASADHMETWCNSFQMMQPPASQQYPVPSICIMWHRGMLLLSCNMPWEYFEFDIRIKNFNKKLHKKHTNKRSYEIIECLNYLPEIPKNCWIGSTRAIVDIMNELWYLSRHDW